MRFSLGTLVLVTFWIGAMLSVFMWRHAWVKEAEIDLDQKLNFLSDDSPDRTRSCDKGMDSTFAQSWQIIDLTTHRELDSIWIQDFNLQLSGFRDDNTLQFQRYIITPENPTSQGMIFRRRFPEWWWGHFYRPEVWCAILLTALLAWRFAKRKQLTTNK